MGQPSLVGGVPARSERVATLRAVPTQAILLFSDTYCVLVYKFSFFEQSYYMKRH